MVCNKCGISKPKEEFRKGRVCRKCEASYSKWWRKTNPDKKRKQDREWYSKANGTVLENYKKRKRAWQKNNPDKVNSWSRSRKALRKGATATLTLSQEREIWEEHGATCFWCGRNATTLDHIVPLQPRTGGLQGHHTKENIVPACQPCNSSKNNEDPLTWYFRNVESRIPN